MDFMIVMIHWIESFFRAIPFSVLVVWVRFSYVIGLILAAFAFGGFTFRPAGGWGLARERQKWDAKALWAAAFTFLAIPLSGLVGSNIVFVQGAQAFETLTDMMALM